MTRAQTATEYLVILAVVIVIALIVVSVLGGIPSIGGGAMNSAQRSVLESQTPLAISAWSVDKMGTKIIFRNNANYNVKLTSVSIEGYEKSISATLRPGQQYEFVTLGAKNSDVSQYEFDVGYTYIDVSTGAEYTKNSSDLFISGRSSSGTNTFEGSSFYETAYGYTLLDSSSPTDIAQFSHTLALNGDTAFDNSQRAFSFDGNGDYIDFTNSQDIVSPSTYTISMWINPTITATDKGSHMYIFYSTPIPSGSHSLTVHYYFHPTNNYLYYGGRGGSSYFTTIQLGDEVALDEWHYLACVHNGSELVGFDCYHNGILRNFTSDNVNTLNDLDTIRISFTTNQSFQGHISNFAIYNTSLTKSQLDEIYAAGR